MMIFNFGFAAFTNGKFFGPKVTSAFRNNHGHDALVNPTILARVIQLVGAETKDLQSLWELFVSIPVELSPFRTILELLDSGAPDRYSEKN